MSKLVFTSDDLPPELGDDRRFAHWRDLHDSLYCGIDLYRPDDRPFSVKFEFARHGDLTVGRFEGTIRRMDRRKEAIRRDANDDFCFALNSGASKLTLTRPGSAIELDHGTAALATNTDVGEVMGGPENSWITVNIPRQNLMLLVAEAEDLLSRAIDTTSEPMLHLRRYLTMLTGAGDDVNDPALAAHIGATLTDLVALALGAAGDAARIAGMRGLRAARVQRVLAGIRAGYLSPVFSSKILAARLGFSERYIQDLLQETGTSFSERVLELRLQHARTILTARRYDALKIIDIAYASGFNDVSYFNRQFRRRFGAAPGDFRRGRGLDK